jgi:hypothetical protein
VLSIQDIGDSIYQVKKVRNQYNHPGRNHLSNSLIGLTCSQFSTSFFSFSCMERKWCYPGVTILMQRHCSHKQGTFTIALLLLWSVKLWSTRFTRKVWCTNLKNEIWSGSSDRSLGHSAICHHGASLPKVMAMHEIKIQTLSNSTLDLKNSSTREAALPQTQLLSR